MHRMRMRALMFAADAVSERFLGAVRLTLVAYGLSSRNTVCKTDNFPSVYNKIPLFERGIRLFCVD